MFVSFPKTLGIFGSVLSVGGIGTGAVYVTTQKTISDSLGKYRIVSKDGNENIWDKLKKRLDGTDEPKPTPKSQIFIALKEKKKTKEELRDSCQNSGKNIYWTIFSKDESLMEDVKKFCSITIKDSFEGSSKLLKTEKHERSGDKSKFENNMEKLKQEGEKKDSLHKSLEDIYEEIKDKQDSKDLWEKLAEWCSKSYKSYFLNKEDVLWKNVETYCKE